MQQHYSVSTIELLTIVKTFKEFKGMLWGQRTKVYTDHINLIQDALGLTYDHVYWWRFLLKEYVPEIVHIKGIHNTVADAISRLDFGPVKDEKAHWMTLTKGWYHYTRHDPNEGSPYDHQKELNTVFTNHSEEILVSPLTVSKIAQAQRDDAFLKKLRPHDKYSTQLVDDTQLLCKDGKMVMLQNQAVSWHHHYLQLPEHTCLE